MRQRPTPKIQKYSEVQTSPGPLQQPGSFGRLRPTANGWTGVSVQLRQPGSQGVRQASENQRPPPAPAGPDYLTAESVQLSQCKSDLFVKHDTEIMLFVFFSLEIILCARYVFCGLDSGEERRGREREGSTEQRAETEIDHRPK